MSPYFIKGKSLIYKLAYQDLFYHLFKIIEESHKMELSYLSELIFTSAQIYSITRILNYHLYIYIYHEINLNLV